LNGSSLAGRVVDLISVKEKVRTTHHDRHASSESPVRLRGGATLA
jgi:hypothetical protein